MARIDGLVLSLQVRQSLQECTELRAELGRLRSREAVAGIGPLGVAVEGAAAATHGGAADLMQDSDSAAQSSALQVRTSIYCYRHVFDLLHHVVLWRNEWC